jgi:hypothetical protein
LPLTNGEANADCEINLADKTSHRYGQFDRAIMNETWWSCVAGLCSAALPNNLLS